MTLIKQNRDSRQERIGKSISSLVLFRDHFELFNKPNRYNDGFGYVYYNYKAGHVLEINPYYLKILKQINNKGRLLEDMMTKGIFIERSNINKDYIYPNYNNPEISKILKLHKAKFIYSMVWNNYINSEGLFETPEILSYPEIMIDLVLLRLLFPNIGMVNTYKIVEDYGFENIFSISVINSPTSKPRYVLNILKKPVIEIYKIAINKYLLGRQK